MRLGEIYDIVIMKLKEDWDSPEFWKEYEIFLYLKMAINEAISRTNIVLNDRKIPIFPSVSNTGFYAIPNTIDSQKLDVHKIKAIYWKDTSYGINYDVPLKIQRPFEMDMYDHQWRTKMCESGEIPTHAIFYGGEITDFSDTAESMISNYTVSSFAKMKIKLYPSPIIPQDVIDDLLEYNNLIAELNDSGDSIGVFRANTGDVTDVVNNVEIDGISSVGSSGDTISLITALNSLESSISQYVPFILYQPMFDIDYDETDKTVWRNVDLNFLPYDLQLSVIDKVRAQCYDKDGSTQDLNKSAIYDSKFSKSVIDNTAENTVFQKMKKTRNRMFP